MKQDPNGTEGDEFMKWWSGQDTKRLSDACRFSAWNAWCARASLSEADQRAIKLLRAWVAGCGDEAFSTKEQVKELRDASGEYLASLSDTLDEPSS